MKRALLSLSLLCVACGGAPPPPPTPPTVGGPTRGELAEQLLGCPVAPDLAPPEVAAHTLPPVPCWTNKYVDRIDENVRYFNLSGLMRAHGLSRLQAVELQNHYRDLMRAEPGRDKAAAFATALDRVQAGQFESGIDPAALAAAKFIVVFDLDETLYDQRKATADCADASFEVQSGGEAKPKHIKMVPGWQEAIAKIRDLDGLVVLFSANLDDSTLENLSKIMLDGVPLTESSAIAGIMTNSYLTQQSTLEPPGTAEAPWKGQPVFEPSKDLRHFDESLERVILVDDNPLRFFQFRNSRTFQKFHADQLCGAADPELRAAYAGAMPAVVAEIEESVAWMKGNPGATFATAYLPYSDLGAVTLRFLTDTRGWDRARAIAYIRANPGVVSARF